MGVTRMVLVFLLACLLGVVTSCDNPDDTEGTAGPATGEAVVTSLPTDEAAETSADGGATGDKSDDSGLFVGSTRALADHIDIGSFSGILSQFESYEYQLEISFIERTTDGKAANWELVNRHVLFSNAAGFYSELQYQGDESILHLDRVTVIELNGRSYLYLPEVGCIVNSSISFVDPYMGAPFLDRVIGPILNASDTGERVEIHGSAAYRYVFNGESLPEWELENTDASGEIYLADNGFPVRLVLSANGQRDFLGQNAIQVGEFALSLDFLNINEETFVDLPSACTDQPDYPILSDAFDITLLEEFVTYKSRVSLAEAVVFYQDEMATAGWTVDNSLVIEDSAFLSFSSEDRQATVNIDQNGENEPIVIVISE